jgi:hypothetical protein
MTVKSIFQKIKKPLLVITLVVIACLSIVIAFLSPIARYAVEKYDTKFLGREITMDLPYINPFTGFVYLRNLKVYEVYNDSVFFSAKSLSVNTEMLKLFSKSYEFDGVVLREPFIRVTQNKKNFNFSDIIHRFQKDSTDVVKPSKDPVSWKISDIAIKNAIIYYEEKSIPFKYFIKEFNVKCESLGGLSDTLIADFNFKSGPSSGSVKGNYSMNLKNVDYSIKVNISKFDISLLEPYVKDVANFAYVRGNLDSDIQAFGNIKETVNLTTSGNITLNDCHFGKDSLEDYAYFKKFNLSYTQISPKKKIYKIDSVYLFKPYFKYEMYDQLDNLQRMFGKNGEKVKDKKSDENNHNILFTIGEFAKKLSLNFFKGAFKINKIGLYEGNFVFNDFKPTQKFSVELHPFNLKIDSIERKDTWVDALIVSDLKPYGHLEIKMSVNPKDSSDFKVDYSIKDVPATLINPYLISASSFPLDRGTIELKGKWNVNNGFIDSKNNLLIIDPRISDRQKMNGSKWLPLKFAMFFVRERGNVIDYDVPIKGNLKDPNFKIKDVVLDIITNTFVKPVTPVYRYQIKTLENAIENSLSMKWVFKEAKLKEDQLEFMSDMADYLKDNPETSLTIKSYNYIEKEKEYIALFEGKKQFMQNKCDLPKNLSTSDSIKIDQLSIKDDALNKYLRQQVKDSLVFTTQELCIKLVGQNFINEKFEDLKRRRFEFVRTFFKKNGVMSQVTIDETNYEKVPYDGFSHFKITYQGEIPAYLIEAYTEINYYNSTSPRAKYKAKRKRLRN